MITERHLDLPRLEWHNHWLTPAEYARVTRRSVRTVQYWCSTGILSDFRIPFFRDKAGRWWIQNIP